MFTIPNWPTAVVIIVMLVILGSAVKAACQVLIAKINTQNLKNKD